VFSVVVDQPATALGCERIGQWLRDDQPAADDSAVNMST